MTKVIILGGGIVGMSAAHELVNRGFSVPSLGLCPYQHRLSHYGSGQRSGPSRREQPHRCVWEYSPLLPNLGLARTNHPRASSLGRPNSLPQRPTLERKTVSLVSTLVYSRGFGLGWYRRHVTVVQ